MAQLHLSKVAFGCKSLEALERRVETRASGGELRVATRMRPRRADELIGGNLYWIVSHRIIAASRILRFDDREDGRIDIVCNAGLQSTTPLRRRAHQGWRYVEEESSAAAEASDVTGVADLPPRLYGTLATLALV